MIWSLLFTTNYDYYSSCFLPTKRINFNIFYTLILIFSLLGIEIIYLSLNFCELPIPITYLKIIQINQIWFNKQLHYHSIVQNILNHRIICDICKWLITWISKNSNHNSIHQLRDNNKNGSKVVIPDQIKNQSIIISVDIIRG